LGVRNRPCLENAMPWIAAATPATIADAPEVPPNLARAVGAGA
jgi:hypothetical protein